MHRIFYMYCSIRSAPYGVDHSYFFEFKLLSLKLKLQLVRYLLAQTVSYWAALLVMHKSSYSGDTSGLAYQIGSSLASPRRKSSDRRLSCFYTAKVPPFQSHNLGILGDVDSEVTVRVCYECIYFM